MLRRMRMRILAGNLRADLPGPKPWQLLAGHAGSWQRWRAAAAARCVPSGAFRPCLNRSRAVTTGSQPPDGFAADAVPLRHPARSVDWAQRQVSWAKALLDHCIGRLWQQFCASLSLLKASFKGSC